MGSLFSRSACAALTAFPMLCMAACQLAPAGKPASITYNDTKNLSPEALGNRLVAQLGNLLKPAPPPPRWRRFVGPDRFYDTWLSTTPRLAEGGGMCTYDLLRVKLEPDVRDDDPDGDTPTHAIGLETTTWFTPAPKGSADCAQGDPASAHYFETDRPLDAGQDFDMLKNALAKVRSGAPGFTIDCAFMDACIDLPANVTAESMWDVSACRRPTAEGACRHFSWREPQYMELDIIYDNPKLDRRIVRLHFEPGVVL